MIRFLRIASIFLLACLLGHSTAMADRLKDLTSIAGVRSNQLVGYGVVVGLNGTGDGSSGLTLQSMQSMVSQFGLVTDAANLTAKKCRSGHGDGRYARLHEARSTDGCNGVDNRRRKIAARRHIADDTDAWR